MASTEKLIRIILKMDDQLSKPLQNAANSIEKAGDTATKAGAKIEAAGEGMKRLGASISSVGNSLTVGLTLPLVAVGTASVKMAMDLDRSMRNIQSVGRQTETELAALSDTFIEMSTDITKTTDSASGLAEAFYNIQGSGFEGADAMAVLEAATKAASAGMTNTQVAAQGMIAVINSYGLSAADAARISDLMFTTVDRGVGSFEELTGSMSNVVGLAATLGVPFEEVSAAISTMSKQGFTFSEASVALNQAMVNILKPTEEMGGAITALGYSSGEAMIEALGLGGTIQALSEHVDGSSAAMAGMFSNVRGLRAALALTGTGAAMFAEDLEAMGASTGRTAEAFAIQTQSFDAQWRNFQNTLSAAGIEIGQALLPILSELLKDYIIPAIQWFRSLDENTMGWIIKIGLLVAALGPVLSIIGSIISTLGMLKAGFFAIAAAIPAITAAIPALGAALAFLMSPIGLVIAALAALYIAYETNFLGFRDIVNGFIQFMADAFTILSGQFVDTDNPILNWLNGLVYDIQNAWAVIQNPIEALKQGLYLLLSGDYVRGVFEEDSFITTWLLKIRNAIINFSPKLKELGANLIKGLVQGITSMTSSFIKSVSDMASGAVNAVKRALGIRSPSKVMEKIGINLVEGFDAGIAAMGGMAIQTPQINGSSPNVAARTAPTIGSGFAAMGMGGGVNIGQIIVPEGTSQDQVRFIMQEIAKQTRRRGG